MFRGTDGPSLALANFLVEKFGKFLAWMGEHPLTEQHIIADDGKFRATIAAGQGNPKSKEVKTVWTDEGG